MLIIIKNGAKNMDASIKPASQIIYSIYFDSGSTGVSGVVGSVGVTVLG
jgi:hypothetical protein